jgi:hypothetical protein
MALVREKSCRLAIHARSFFFGRSGLSVALLGLAFVSVATVLAGQGVPPDVLREPASGETAATYESRAEKLMASHQFKQALREYMNALHLKALGRRTNCPYFWLWRTISNVISSQ